MEKPVPHSRQPSGVLSKKSSCNGGSTKTRTVYDDVFGGPPRFGAPTLSPRVEEYNEIFGGFQARRASSIPVLDLPPMDEKAKAFFDVRSCPGFNYNEVFGGFDGHDYGVPYEELVFALTKEKSDGCGVCSSDEEVWTPEDADCVSAELDHSPRNHCQTSGDTCESIDGCMEFNISYHRITQSEGEVVPIGIKHVTQLVDVPAYAYMVDRTTSLPKSVDDHLSLEASNGAHLGIDLSGEMTRGRHLRKTVSHPSKGNRRVQLSGNDSRPQRVISRNGSLPNNAFMTITDVSLKTRPSHLPPPSRPPPPLDVRNREYSQLTGNCARVELGGIEGDSSPPYFDVEVGASSSAAASAAAMKEAMEQAQAKLKSAKELMERKKDGFQSRSKTSSKNGRNSKEEKAVKTVDGSSCREHEGSRSTCAKENGLQYSVPESRQRVFVSTQIVPDSLEGMNHITLANNSEEKNLYESLFSKDFQRIDGVDEWQEATEFFELVKTEQSRKTFCQPSNEDIWVQNVTSHEWEKRDKKVVRGAVMPEQEKKKKVIRADHVIECEKKAGVSKEASEWEGSFGRSEAGEVPSIQKELEEKMQAGDKEFMREESKENHSKDRLPVETEKKHSMQDLLETHENRGTESKSATKPLMKCRGNEPLPQEIIRSMEGKIRFSLEREDNVERLNLFFEQENEGNVKLALEQAEYQRRLTEAVEEEEQKRIKEACEREENEEKLKEAYQKEKNEKREREAFEWEESERRPREALEKEDNKRRERDAAENKENEKREREAHERDEHEKRLKIALQKEENERKRKESVNQEEYEKIQRQACEREKTEKKHEEALAHKEENEQEDTNAREEAEKRFEETSQEKEFREVIEEAPVREVTGKRLKDACEQERNGKLRGAEEEEEIKMVKKEACEIKGIQAACEWQETEVKPKNTGKNDELEGLEKKGKNCIPSNQACKLDDGAKCDHDLNGQKQKTTETTHEEIGKIQAEPGNSQMQSTVKIMREQIGRKSKTFSMAEATFEHEKVGAVTQLPCLTERVKIADESGNDTGENNTDETKPASKLEFEMSKRRKDEDKRDESMSSGVLHELVETRRKIEATQPIIHVTARQFNACHNAEKKAKNIDDSTEGKENERMRREKVLEEERRRKVEEEREREREREKDRMAVDRAVLEAHERAERTAMERATAEARQRALNEARERLEKACAEAREKSQLDKASGEARLRAERAAVERAAAEARERAFQKAMTERAAFQARERMERSVSNKFSTSSRTNGMRPSTSSSDLQDLQSQSGGTFNGSRYQNASVYNNSCYTEIYDGNETESPQRCKARLERHRRTAERAAKALAEKNMRDLLVQREQAERNRLAETLDAEVKRWSSGKEGNLRALLSTLQYILGPGSGWQPIPLTEVITAAAVKKVYRKATLCVHPDKLQQRGASIHHKYICEKVFDLLKEAWNKFNSEER